MRKKIALIALILGLGGGVWSYRHFCVWSEDDFKNLLAEYQFEEDQYKYNLELASEMHEFDAINEASDRPSSISQHRRDLNALVIRYNSASEKWFESQWKKELPQTLGPLR